MYQVHLAITSTELHLAINQLQLALLASVVGYNYYDDRGEQSPSAKGPSPVGSIGNWVLLSEQLTTARNNLAATSLQQTYLYAIGGDGLSSYEYSSLTTTAATSAKDYDRQTMSAFIKGNSNLPSVKSGFGATAYNNVVLVGPSAGDNAVLASSTPSSGGDIGSFTANTNTPQGDFTGSCLVSGNNKIAALAQNNVVVAPCASSSTCDAGYVSAPTPNTKRSNAGCAYAAGTLFVIGGSDSNVSEFALF